MKPVSGLKESMKKARQYDKPTWARCRNYLNFLGSPNFCPPHTRN